MVTIGYKQFLLILLFGFLLFGNLPKRQKELKDFYSQVKNDQFSTYNTSFSKKKSKDQTNPEEVVKKKIQIN